MLNNLKRNKKGFTLIELIIVVAIIAILAAIAVPNFMKAREEAKWGVVYNDAAAVTSALNVWNAMNDTPVSSVETVGDALKEISNLPTNAFAGLIANGIIDYNDDNKMWVVIPKANQNLPAAYGGTDDEG